MPRIKKLDPVVALKTINKGLGTKFLTVAAAKKTLELPFVFAGVQAFRLNTSGPGFEENSPWANVGMSNPRYDEQAFRLLVGHIRDATDAKADLAEWRKVTPMWAPAVRTFLNRGNIPFGVELLQDADINLSGDPPLFSGKAAPTCLIQITSGPGGGEHGYLRSLGANTLMCEVWPSYYRYFHRPQGAPVPDDLVAGLTFGSPKYKQLSDGTWAYVRSPLMSTPSYAAWNAAGQPA